MINTNTLAHHFARPYSQLAPAYDVALGIPNFISTRAAFEALVRRYGILFRTAADIGCGTGLFACYLSRCWGVPVFAVDRSREMLRVATRNCSSPNVCFLQQDIRCLRLPCPVDLVTANFDTLNHLLTGPELQLALRRISENLRPCGHFIFDLITDQQPEPGPRIHIRSLPGVESNVIQRIQWNPWNKMLSIVVTFRLPGSARPAIEVHRERTYSPIEVGRWLQAAGFIIRGVHDAATLRLARGCSSRIIVIARKKGGQKTFSTL